MMWWCGPEKKTAPLAISLHRLPPPHASHFGGLPPQISAKFCHFRAKGFDVVSAIGSGAALSTNPTAKRLCLAGAPAFCRIWVFPFSRLEKVWRVFCWDQQSNPPWFASRPFWHSPVASVQWFLWPFFCCRHRSKCSFWTPTACHSTCISPPPPQQLVGSFFNEAALSLMNIIIPHRG